MRSQKFLYGNSEPTYRKYILFFFIYQIFTFKYREKNTAFPSEPYGLTLTEHRENDFSLCEERGKRHRLTNWKATPVETDGYAMRKAPSAQPRGRKF